MAMIANLSFYDTKLFSFKMTCLERVMIIKEKSIYRPYRYLMV